MSAGLAGRRILVTGASGFYGGHLCRKLAEAGAVVVGVSRARRHVTGHVEWLTSDLTRSEEVQALLRETRPETVFHLSALSSAAVSLDLVEPSFDSIVLSTKNLLVAAALHGRPRTILVGTFEKPAPGETPASPYGAAKVAAGAYGRLFNALYGVPVVMVRPFMTYGPGQSRTKVVPYAITSLLREIPPRLASGRRRVDWIYVDDVIAGMIDAATIPGLDGATLDLGTGRLVAIRDVVETIVRIVGPAVRPEFGALPDRPNEVSRAADVDATTRLTGWRPRVPLDEGLARTIAWYREHLDDED